MKKTLFTTLVLGMTLSGISVFADNDVTLPSTPTVSSVPMVSEKEEMVSTNNGRHQKAKSRADNLIKERINKLQENIKVITSDKSLTADQKTALNTILNTNIAGLTTLQASIATSTDATSTKNLVSSIFTQFRIYGIVIPQVRLEKRIYDLQNHSTKLSDTFIKVQSKIDEYKGKGKDVTVWQKSLDDAKILVANDMNTLANALIRVSALKPVDYGTTSKAVIEQTNVDIKNVLKDFNSIKKNLHKPAAMGNVSKKIRGDGEHSPSPLFGTSWTWISSTVNGVTTTAPQGGKFVLSFGEDNRVNSTTDCNGVGGKYTLGASSSITFGQFMSTMMFCEGSKEAEYSAQLMNTSSYTLDGASLVLKNASGTMMFSKK